MKSVPLIPPVCLTATYRFGKSDDLIDVVQNHSGHLYSRWDNPTVQETEKSLAHLEDYPHALAFGSGMAAITTSILAFIDKSSRIVYQREVYGGTHEFLHDYLPRLGVETVGVNCDDTRRFQEEIEKGLSVLYLETPTNPLLRVVGLEPLVRAAHRQEALVMLDSTFASPLNQHPKDFDVDIVIHSATKFLGGHHDIMGGFICCAEWCFESIWSSRKLLGGIMDPLTAFLCLRGMQTLELRILRQNDSALKIARFLEKQEKVRAVHYPGLSSHPDHETAKRQMKGFGGMLSFELDADFEKTKSFMDSLKFIKLATSLGGVTSLATQPITNTHVGLSPESRAKAGISESLVRLSVGVEKVELLIQDLTQALCALD
ncbi:MAG: aminotransferase class I/II-fold pyridoxal phosphate-dependent enzyme [Candidatus Aminicenantes bacterium]|nr:aminotransferase class I/II-fold pyridoxal phosphate-dependent enzyme [Candidatus Aminicenantes bacterium]